LGDAEAEKKTLEEVLRRSVHRLLAMVSQAADLPSFAAALRDQHFAAYVRASLPREFAVRFLEFTGQSGPSAEQPHEEISHDPAS
jgi:hypothetical protein